MITVVCMIKVDVDICLIINGNNFINTCSRNTEKYFSESCSESTNNQLFSNLIIKTWAGFNEVCRWFDEQIQEKLTYM